jgi:REP element-mobilizing transposase RayT
MSRIARIVVQDLPFHITQRGNARQEVFTHSGDHELFLDLLQTHSATAALEILAYCLMPNHVHLIAIPRRATAMADTLRLTHANYARYFNLKPHLRPRLAGTLLFLPSRRVPSVECPRICRTQPRPRGPHHRRRGLPLVKRPPPPDRHRLASPKPHTVARTLHVRTMARRLGNNH